MKKIMEQWGDFSFEEPKKVPFLTLPNSVMEHICRFLPTTFDKYIACLIHPQWSTAAQNVLWEKPRFSQPQEFRRFLKTIRESKKKALLVRDVYLVLLDKEPTLFSLIVKSTMDKHLQNPLQDPLLMIQITSVCENISSLTIYGRILETIHIERIASKLQALTSLHIIGAKQNHELALNSLFPRLTTLRLDGNFHISSKWADVLITKAIHLTELQISLQDMDLDTLAKICTPHNLPRLTSLTLTDARYLVDNHVVKILEAFPQLIKLCIEGSTQLTALSILISLNACPNLNSLEIRANSNSLQHEMDDSKLNMFYNNIRTGALPSRLLIENLNLDNDQLVALSPYLSYIQTLGFKDCPLLTADGITLALCESKYLRLFQVINCINIDSSILKSFADMNHISKSIYRIHIESSGSVDPKDIYHLCCNSVDFNIREIKFVHYDNLKSSIIGSFNQGVMNNRYEDDDAIICLDRRSIDAIAHSKDPELCPGPEGRFLSGNLLTRLSQHLRINTHKFIHLLDVLEQELIEEENEQAISSRMPKKRKSLNRLNQLKAESHTTRSTTPALWSHDFSMNNLSSIYHHQPPRSDDTLYVADEYHTSDTQEITEEEEDYEEEQEEEDDDDEEEVDEEEEQEDDDHSINKQDMETAGSEISLGGWGVSITDQWNAKQQQQQQYHQAQQQQAQAQQQQQYRNTPPSRTSKSSQPTTQPTTQPTQWTGFVEEDYKDQWQQTSFVPAQTKPSFKRESAKHYRNSPVVTDSEGWGSAETVVPWHESLGFVKEVIEEQQKTPYWNGEAYINGGSTEQTPPPPSPPPPTKSQGSGKSTPTLTSSPPILFSSLTSSLSQSQPASYSSNSAPRSRRDSVVSTDGEVCWNDSTNNVIKLNPDELSPLSSTPTPKFSVERKSKWATAEEWNTLKGTAAAITTTTITTTASNTPRPSHWSNNNSEASSSVSAAAAAAPRRPTFSRPRTDSGARKNTVSNNHVDQNKTNKWSNFMDNPSSPPSRVNNASPVTKPYTAPNTPATSSVNSVMLPVTSSINSVMLIDTDNSPGLSARPVPKGDVWESLSTLEIPPADATTTNSDSLLMPQEATTTIITKEVPQETINWNVIDSDVQSSKQEESMDFFHFTDIVSGTATEAERKLNEEEQKKDKVVELEDLVSLSTPEYSPRVAASPIPATTNTTNTTTTDVPIEDNNASSVNNTNSLNGIESLASPTSATNTTQTESPAPKPELHVYKSNPDLPDLKLDTDLVESKLPAESENLNNSGSETEKKTMKPIRLRVKLADDSFSELIVNDGDDIQAVVSNFCKENGLESSESELYKKAVEKRTKMILRRGKKSKKSNK